MKGKLLLVLVLPVLISAGCFRSGKSTDVGTPQAKKQEEKAAPTESRRGTEGAGGRRRWSEMTAEERAERLERRAEALAEELGLGEEKREKVKAELVEMYKKMGETFAKMREQGGFDREKRREAMQKVRAKYEGALRKILSAEQFEKYQKLQERRRAERSRRARQ